MTISAFPRAGLSLLFCAVVCTAAAPARAGGLDVRGWLDRPGTRLVVVEFYASWCKPCMAAVPEWKALHERYRDQGLRLIVVSTMDPEGQCVNPGWNPDEMVCDPDGEIAAAFRLDGKLPAAFLWSWQGNLLVNRGHVQEVAAQVEAYLTKNPRILVEAKDGAGKPYPRLHELVRTRLSQSGKLTVVATRAERQALAKIRKQSYQAKFADKMQCQLGQEVSANSLLKAALTGKRGKQRLSLTLFSAESACLLTGATAPWNAKRPGLAVAEAVDRMLSKLKQPLQMPGLGGVRPPGGREEEIGEPVPDAPPPRAGALVLVQFNSEPGGAVVMVDRKLLCTTTPCSRSLAAGRHRVEMQKERFEPASLGVDVKAGMGPVALLLVPSTGFLSVHSTPSGLQVTLDGKPFGKTPIDKQELDPGGYTVLVTDPAYYDKGKKVVIAKGEHEQVDVELVPRTGELTVTARLASGDEVAADVYLDDKKIGQTPLTTRVTIGKHKFRVSSATHGETSGEENVGEKKPARLDVYLYKRQPNEKLSGSSASHCRKAVNVFGLHRQKIRYKATMLTGMSFCDFSLVDQVTFLLSLQPAAQRKWSVALDAQSKESMTQLIEIRIVKLGKIGTQLGLDPLDVANQIEGLKALKASLTGKGSPPPAADAPSKVVDLDPVKSDVPQNVLNHKTDSPFEKHNIRFRHKGHYLRNFSKEGIVAFLEQRDLDEDDYLESVQALVQVIAANAAKLAGGVFSLTDPELGLRTGGAARARILRCGPTLEMSTLLPAKGAAFVNVLKLKPASDCR